MNTKALKDLIQIASIEGIGHNAGQRAREIALKGWVEDWLVEVSSSQSVIVKENLTSEEEDFVKYYLSYRLGEELMEDCVDVKSTSKGITTKVWALRRK